MTISDLTGRIKEGVPGDILIIAILVLSASAAFGLGYLAGRDAGGQRSGVWIENLASSTESTALGGPAAAEAATVSASGPAPATGGASAQTGSYVASRTGKKYYLATCSSAKRITDANKVYFNTKAEAEAKGYTPAANCPGL